MVLRLEQKIGLLSSFSYFSSSFKTLQNQAVLDLTYFNMFSILIMIANNSMNVCSFNQGKKLQSAVVLRSRSVSEGDMRWSKLALFRQYKFYANSFCWYDPRKLEFEFLFSYDFTICLGFCCRLIYMPKDNIFFYYGPTRNREVILVRDI